MYIYIYTSGHQLGLSHGHRVDQRTSQGRKKVFLATGNHALQLKTAVILGGCTDLFGLMG